MSTVRSALDALTERFTYAWNERDIGALRSMFDEDADFIDPSGSMWHGRSAIVAEHSRLFRGALAHSNLRVQIAKIRMLSRTSALIYGIWSMTGHMLERVPYLPVRTGLSLFVARRANGAWVIVCAHIADIPAGEP
jgi:uncharacterized protein (TIGR02246 family)